MYTKPPRAVGLLLKCAAAGLVLWALGRFILPWLAPFLIAAALAAAVEPLVRLLCAKRLPRGVASGLCVSALLAAAGGLLWLCAARAADELKGFAAGLPELVSGLDGALGSLQGRMAALWGDDGFMTAAVRSLIVSLEELPGQLSGRLLGFLSSAAAKAPAVLLFTVTVGIGSYFLSASFPTILSFAARQLPDGWLRVARQLCADVKRSLWSWLRSQLILMLITFGELIVALTLLRVRYAVLVSLATALIDALPVFGAGIVLLPWAAYQLLAGDYALGVGLAVAWAVVTLLRSCIQAKLLGDQLGLHPLATLLAIYVGFRVWGVAGMVVAPIAAITVKQLNERGVVRLWKREEPDAALRQL